ncbi:MAG: phenylalanine--tRNA ligase subunit beta [Candidatus Woesebacteria bacterium]
MKVPIKWLAEYVSLPDSVTDLTTRLTAIGHMQDHQPETIGDDTVLDLEVRQNRSDCLSILGVAREVSASMDQPLTDPSITTPPLPETTTPSMITIADPLMCYRFEALVIDNVTVAPSPTWLAEKVEHYGMKSINNVVDITNFVMIELGEPLHAFDKVKVADSLTIRAATNGEKFEVLGGKTISLSSSDIVVANDSDILAMGGIIGGKNSGITESTTSIVLEAATYNQAYIRRSSIRHSLRTEASLRHEKFLHPDLAPIALRRAASLLKEVCGGTISAHHDEYVTIATPVHISMSLTRFHELTGITVDTQKALSILQSLGIEASLKNEDIIETSIPYFRTDLLCEEDVIEEVLRIVGYDTIPDTLPRTSPPVEITSPSVILEEKLRDLLVDLGFEEVITEPLVNEEHPKLDPVVLQNSLNSDKTMLRTTLENGLFSALSYQKKTKRTDLSLFEVGKIYFKENDSYTEQKVLAGVVTAKTATYAKVKGIVEALCLKAGRKLDDTIASIIRHDTHTWYFQIMTEKLMQKPAFEITTIKTALPQIVYQDISLSVPKAIPVGPILEKVRNFSPLIVKAALGEYPIALPDERKSVFLKLHYHKAGEQLNIEDVEPIKNGIIAMIETDFQGTLRK